MKEYQTPEPTPAARDDASTFQQSMDASLWAAAFADRVAANPSLTADRGFMISWFANALMRGYDTAMARRDGLIAGALYDFLGCLTTLHEPITLSENHAPHRALEVLTEWAKGRELKLDNADVKHWDTARRYNAAGALTQF